ncbi:MAG: Rrf2 family transcriptional regulator [Steroidobacteraceae bacterium]|nr:Rrf2 family transcriptional regulator [Steroidobacteraceae bacterium]
MRLAAFTDYGLRVLMRLANAPDESFTTAEIAAQFSIPYNHLAKVVQDLVRGGYVTTRRGAGGGMRLARPAETITLGEVVRFLEQRYPVVECFRRDGGACVLTPQCRLKAHIAVACEKFLQSLEQTTVAECAYPGPPPPPARAAKSTKAAKAASRH